MVFTSPTFLFAFLPVVLAGSVLVPKRARNGWLLLSSFVFYSWGGGILVVLLVVSTVADFAFGRLVHSANILDRPRLKRIGIIGSVMVNIGLLSYFKYANFLVEQLNRLGDYLGVGTIAWTSVTLPIGISFYTFQTMSYTLDLARGRGVVLKRISDFGLYVSFFPQLVAGPIVRYHEIYEEIIERSVSIDRFSAGAARFMVGLSKKVIVADQVATIADRVFAVDPTSLAATDAWVGILAYTVQIYFDFSGYSDMAIGLGHMFGFAFPENFRRPYSAVSITDFWRRWHITLSNWFRDYVYIPLGGSRVKPRRVYLNLVLVFLVTGLWHGANWTFVVWGTYHGAIMLIERQLGQRPVEGDSVSYASLRRAATLLLVMVGWVIFRSPSITHGVRYLIAMVGHAPTAGAVAPLLGVAAAPLVTLTAASMVVLLPGSWVAGVHVSDLPRISSLRVRVITSASLTAAFGYALILVLAGTFSPFLYFQF